MKSLEPWILNYPIKLFFKPVFAQSMKSQTHVTGASNSSHVHPYKLSADNETRALVDVTSNWEVPFWKAKACQFQTN